MDAVGLLSNVPVTPAGNPVAVSVTAAAKFVRTNEIDVSPLPFCGMETMVRLMLTASEACQSTVYVSDSVLGAMPVPAPRTCAV